MTSLFHALPGELVAVILSQLDVSSLITVAYTSKRFHSIASDFSLNPWRQPILRAIQSASWSELTHLSVRAIVPRQNWVEVLSLAPATFILFQATLPNLKSDEWEECFNRRFLPGLRRWKKDGTWKEAFLKVLHRLWHRSVTSCSSDEAWTKYIVLNRNGSANELEISSHNFNPLHILNEMKFQSDLLHLETRVRLVVELADVRILAFGTLNKPRSGFSTNPNAHAFLHPPGIQRDATKNSALKPPHNIADHGIYPVLSTASDSAYSSSSETTSSFEYSPLMHPLPASGHANYPYYTPSGSDKRWLGPDDDDEFGLQWVGGLLIVAQILGPRVHEVTFNLPPLQDLNLVVGSGRQQYTSFCWADLSAIAPWLVEKITTMVDGQGLGI